MVKTALMEQIPENVFIDRGPELPDSYGLRKMVAMVKNPYWIYVYWDLPAGDCARAGASGVRAAVKIYDLTDDVVYDVGIDLGMGRHYFNVGGDRSYTFEVGLMTPGGWEKLAASRPVATPPTGPGSGEEKWVRYSEGPPRKRRRTRRLRPRPGRPDKKPVVVTPGFETGARLGIGDKESIRIRVMSSQYIVAGASDVEEEKRDG